MTEHGRTYATCHAIWGSHGCALDMDHMNDHVCGCGDAAAGRAVQDTCHCGAAYMSPDCHVHDLPAWVRADLEARP